MSETPEPARTPSEAAAAIDIHAPSERNRKLAAFLGACNADPKLKARWIAQQTTAERLGMSDHSWVHLQIVLNMALRIFRLLRKHGVESAVERDHGMKPSDAAGDAPPRQNPARRRGLTRRPLPAPRHRHVDPPRRPRGVQPLPRRRRARRPARGRLRGA